MMTKAREILNQAPAAFHTYIPLLVLGAIRANALPEVFLLFQRQIS